MHTQNAKHLPKETKITSHRKNKFKKYFFFVLFLEKGKDLSLCVTGIKLTKYRCFLFENAVHKLTVVRLVRLPVLFSSDTEIPLKNYCCSRGQS